MSFGRVKSYGSVTTLVNCVGSGAQGSPCFNELGKCWGFIVNSHNDIPEKWANAVLRRKQEEEELMQDIDKKIRKADKEAKRGRPKKDKKKRDKKRKRRRHHFRQYLMSTLTSRARTV